MKGSTSKKYKDPRKHALLFKCKGWELYEATTSYTDTNKKYNYIVHTECPGGISLKLGGSIMHFEFG